MQRLGTRLHARLYRLTGGRLFGRIGGQPVLLLETRGRRTGRHRATPLQYLRRDDSFVVVAANHGGRRPPAWSLNLRDHPHANLQVGRQRLDVRARQTEGWEREALWQNLTTTNRYLPRIAQKARRDLPVIVLTPEQHQ
jgi:deazaflavin-dependent oxidoreductase (nitroreductase family)